MSIEWPKERYVGRQGDMAPRGEMQITLGLQTDGDVVIEVWQKRGYEEHVIYAQCEFCALGAGGGRSKHTREALIALMVAIEKDNAESPTLAFPFPAQVNVDK